MGGACSTQWGTSEIHKAFCWFRERRRQLGRTSSRCKDITMHGTNNIKKCKDNVRINLKIIKWDDLAG